MTFRVIDHYYIELNQIHKNIEYEYDNEECFICFETKFDNKEGSIKLNSSLDYIKNCCCDGFIHKKCLEIWLRKHCKCPICRNDMHIRAEYSLIINNDTTILFTFIIIKNNIIKLLHLFRVCFYVFFICEFYLFLYYVTIQK